jgi:hypothetical protein
MNPGEMARKAASHQTDGLIAEMLATTLEESFRKQRDLRVEMAQHAIAQRLIAIAREYGIRLTRT